MRKAPAKAKMNDKWWAIIWKGAAHLANLATSNGLFRFEKVSSGNVLSQLIYATPCKCDFFLKESEMHCLLTDIMWDVAKCCYILTGHHLTHHLPSLRDSLSKRKVSYFFSLKLFDL